MFQPTQDFTPEPGTIILVVLGAYAWVFICLMFLVIIPRRRQEEQRSEAWKTHRRAIFAAQKKGRGRGRGKRGGRHGADAGEPDHVLDEPPDFENCMPPDDEFLSDLDDEMRERDYEHSRSA